MSDYIKDPEEVYKLTVSYKYSVELSSENITDTIIQVKDSSGNDITNGILVPDTIEIDNIKKEVSFYIQGGVNNSKIGIYMESGFSHGLVVVDSIFYDIVKKYTYLTKKAAETLPVIMEYNNIFSLSDILIESYTVQCFKNNVLVNYITITSIEDNNKITAFVSNGIKGERLEIVFKIVASDSMTVFVDRIYLDIR